MAFMKVDHVAMLADDIAVGKHVFCDGWGLAINEHRSPWPQGRPGTFDGVTSIEIPIGEMYLEISKPNDTTSPAARFVVEHRAGMYHIALASNDLPADVRLLQDRGIRVAGEWDGRGAVFLDPTTTLGLRIRVVPEEGYYVHPYYRGDGTFTGMGHIGIAARSADEIRALFGGAFGLREDKTAERGGEPPPDFDPARPASDPVHLIEYPLGWHRHRDQHPDRRRHRHCPPSRHASTPRRRLSPHLPLRTGCLSRGRERCRRRATAHRRYAAARKPTAGGWPDRRRVVPPSHMRRHAHRNLEPGAGRRAYSSVVIPTGTDQYSSVEWRWS